MAASYQQQNIFSGCFFQGILKISHSDNGPAIYFLYNVSTCKTGVIGNAAGFYRKNQNTFVFSQSKGLYKLRSNLER